MKRLNVQDFEPVFLFSLLHCVDEGGQNRKKVSFSLIYQKLEAISSSSQLIGDVRESSYLVAELPLKLLNLGVHELLGFLYYVIFNALHQLFVIKPSQKPE